MNKLKTLCLFFFVYKIFFMNCQKFIHKVWFHFGFLFPRKCYLNCLLKCSTDSARRGIVANSRDRLPLSGSKPAVFCSVNRGERSVQKAWECQIFLLLLTAWKFADFLS